MMNKYIFGFFFSIHLEFEPADFTNLKLIMNGHYRAKVKNNDGVLVFTVDRLVGQFLYFEINDWECMKPLALKKAWLE